MLNTINGVVYICKQARASMIVFTDE